MKRLGGKNLKLQTSGRYLCDPDYGKKGHKTLGNCYNTILQANDFPHQDHFTQLDPNLREVDLQGPSHEMG